MKCPLCGYGIVDAERCTACPVAGKDCALTRCPNCGYTFPPDSAIVKLFQKLGGNFSRRKVPPNPPSRNS